MIDLFGVVFLWGIPVLLMWSIILSILHTVKYSESGQFLGRIVTFIGAIYTYFVGSFAAWFGLICIFFGLIGFTEGAIIWSLLCLSFGVFMVYQFFPCYKMLEE